VSVGASLAQAREERGLSVEDVSTATRIRAGLIRAIEADDFSGCGGGVYARGHIRSISRTIGIDPEPLIAEFDRSHLDDPPPALVPTSAVDAEAAARADGRQPNWAAAMAVALVVICALAAVSLIGNSRGAKKEVRDDLPGPIVTTAPPTTGTTRSPAATPPPDSVAHLPQDQAIALIRVNTSQTWMKVTTFSGKVLFEGLLGAGERKVFRDAKGLSLTIGNAPAVDLVANGEDVGSPRSQGNVAHVTIARGSGVQYA
jgi:cytoskeleton protein RodZ